MEFRKCEGTLRALFSEIDQRGRAGCGESRQSGSVGGMRRRTIRQRALSLPNWDTHISALLNSPTVSGRFVRQEDRAKQPLGEGAPAYGCRQSTLVQPVLKAYSALGGTGPSRATALRVMPKWRRGGRR